MIRRFGLAVLLCFGFALASYTPIYAASQATVQLLGKARSLEGRGRLDLASHAWEQVLLAEPDNTEAVAGLARYAKQSGKKQEADRYLEQLRKLDPKNVAIGRVDDLHSIESQRGRLDEAQRLAAGRNFEGAMRLYRLVFGNEPPAGGWSIAYYETLASCPGGWDEATAALDRLLQKYPDAPEYRLSLGRLWTYRPQTRVKGFQMLESVKGDALLVEKARAAWRQALVWDSGNPASAPFLKSYLDRYADPELARVASQSVVKKKNEDQPQARGPVQSPEDGLGYKALRAGKLAEAEAHFQADLKNSPHSVSALAGMGYIRMKQEEFEAAVPLFQQTLSLQPRNKAVMDALSTSRFWSAMKSGASQMSSGDMEQAIENFKQALALRPQSVDAAEALAGAYLKAQQPGLAAPVYEHLVHLKPQSADDWFGLVKSIYQAGQPSQALASVKQAPENVKESWLQDAGHLALLSFLYADAGKVDESRRLFEKGQSVAAGKNAELPVDLQLEFAGLSQRIGHPSQAAAAFDHVTQSHPGNVQAWEGLIGSLLQTDDNNRAYSALRRMPKSVSGIALTHPGFLCSVAKLEVAMKRYDLAEASLKKAIELEKANGKQPDGDAEQQLAGIWLNTGKSADAERLLRTVLDQHPDSTSAWLSLLSMLHNAKRDAGALEEIRRMPGSVSVALYNDPAFVAVLSGVYTNSGDYDEAQHLIRSSISRLEAEGKQPSIDLRIQLAWSLLNGKGNSRELYSILDRYSTRSDLTASQKNDFTQIWSIWCDRRAQAAVKQGDYAQAVSILEAAAKVIPQDTKVRGSLAGVFMSSGDPKSALAVYKGWGLRGGSADDYSSAIGAAMTVPDKDLAIQWLNRALVKFPHNSRVLSLAGKEAAIQGDYKRAKIYLREALAQLPPDQRVHLLNDGTPEPELGDTPAGRIALQKKLGLLLLQTSQIGTHPDEEARSLFPNSDGGFPALPSSPAPVDSKPEQFLDLDPDLSAAPASAKPVTLLTQRQRPRTAETSFVDSQMTVPEYGEVDRKSGNDGAYADPGLDLTPGNAAPSANEIDSQAGGLTGTEPVESAPMLFSASAKSLPAKQDQPNLHDEITGDIQAIDSRDTPFFENGARIQGRGGQGGFDKLMVEEAELAASATIGNQIRLSLIARPTYLDSGTPDGTSTLGFGTTATSATPGSQTAFGIAAEAQLATRDLGIRLGMTPDGFAVRNWIGGLRINPAGGPFTLLLSRDSIRDTKLSFAGERDPATGQVWGGVVANAASVLGNWGTDKSGFYTNLGYQLIQGKQVASNSQISATMGTYFKVLSRKDGALTVGLNFSGMHYDKNLRYFTVGQGGYFSPQQYFLANVPVRWTGTWNRVLQYSITGSLGVQHFQEDASQYFPLAHTGSYYPAYANTGGNYGLEFRTLYQMTPQWLAGTFVNVNNARDYRNASVGIYLKYLFQARPLNADINIDSVPDWKGSQPFALPLSN